MNTEDLIFQSIEEINKHIGVINGELGRVDSRLAVLETQVASILWLQRLIFGTGVVAVVGAILALVTRHRKHNKK